MNVGHSVAKVILRHARERESYMRLAREEAIPRCKRIFVNRARHANGMIVRELRWLATK